MGVLTHLDSFKDNKRLKKTKKVLKHRFWAEIYQGEAALFYLHSRLLVVTNFVHWKMQSQGLLAGKDPLLPNQAPSCLMEAGIRYGKHLQQ